MNISRKIIFVVYILVMLVMGAATIIEKYHGTGFVHTHMYGSWWFSLLWAVLMAAAVFYFVKRRVRTVSTVCLHLSFVIILVGAFLTHVMSRQGMLHLRQGETTDVYFTQADNAEGVEEHKLPFTLQLEKFDIVYHSGTTAVADYITQFTVTDGDNSEKATVSMNNIFTYKGYRFYQSSYDDDGRGSILSINYDPFGIPVTYTGYALLFLSLVWILIDAKGPYRRLFSSPLIRRSALAVMFCLAAVTNVQAVPTLPKETAEKFGRLYILYNDRICPMQTFAIDFTKKLCGKSSYNGLTAEQVLTGFVFYGNEWGAEPVIKLKKGAMKERLQLPDHISVNSFFNAAMGGYTIGPYVQEYYQGNHDKFHTQAADIDDKLQMVFELRRGTLMKIFPYTEKGTTTWFAPTDKRPATMDKEHSSFMDNVFSVIYGYVLQGDFGSVDKMLDKMISYQEKYGAQSLPTPTQVKAERAYNAVPFATILFMVNLTLGFLTLFYEIYRLTRRGESVRRGRTVGIVSLVAMFLSFAALTVCLALRWIASGKVPMANGYETMLFMAWLVMLAAMISCRRFRIVLTFGFLMSGFFLLVSHIGQMDSNIGHVMPVLNSPLLSLHVSVIMTAFALLSLTFICGLTAMLLSLVNRRGDALAEQLASLQLLSRLFLYPAMTFLGIGIFVGAIWANVSWGNYWGWDPKEVWALITFMVYAIALHTRSIKSLDRPMTFHTFMVFAFLTILMTYFGVNYFLSGMHSYA